MKAKTITDRADRVSLAMMTATTRNELIAPLVEVLKISDQCEREAVMVGLGVAFCGQRRNDLVAFLMSVLSEQDLRNSITFSVSN